MDFTFDLSQTPLIGRRFPAKNENKGTCGAAASPRRSVSLSPADSATVAGWKRPWMSQVYSKTRIRNWSKFYKSLHVRTIFICKQDDTRFYNILKAV